MEHSFVWPTRTDGDVGQPSRTVRSQPPEAGESLTVSSAVVRLLQRLALLLFTLLVILIAYGFYYFPAAPIRAVDGQFIDKLGQVHSRQEFEHLHTWERVYVGTWLAMFAATVAFQLAKRRAREP